MVHDRRISGGRLFKSGLWFIWYVSLNDRYR